jgi:thioredoxin-related protein
MKPAGLRHLPALLILPLLLAACGVLGKKDPPEQPFGPSGIPPQLRARTSGDADGGQALLPGGNVVPQAPPANMTPEEDIVFTDPDNPTAALPELTTLLANPSRGPWEESETVARRRSVREGKPVLIWFTHSERSPMCRALSEELFSTPDFERWAAEKVIRLRVDANTRVADPQLSIGERDNREVELRRYVSELKKRYNVLGHPSVVVLNPGGEVISRPRGYKRGQAEYFWGLLKHAEAVSSTAYVGWRAELEKKGYRDWTDREGRTVFAKLARYVDGELVLIEPDGTRSRTREAKLSSADRDWIAEQKRLRSID